MYLVKVSKKCGSLNSFNCALIGLCVSKHPKVEFGGDSTKGYG